MIAYMNNKRIGIISIVIVLGAFSLVLLNSKLDNKETVLDEVKLKESKVSKKSFAIMIQKEDKTGYEASTSNTWPTNMVYNKFITTPRLKYTNKYSLAGGVNYVIILL